jgi:hypothetical protein
MQPMTENEFKEALPVEFKKSVNPILMKQVNGILADPETMQYFRENVLSYTGVMKEGRFKTSQYINAIRYVSFKLFGASNKDAYAKTFPEKMVYYKKQGTSSKDIASYSTAYNKTKLVNLIFAQTMIPVHILNASTFQAALNVQAGLMMTAYSEKVRCDAADSVLKHLKPPEIKAQVELDIGTRQDKTLDILRDTTSALVNQQKAMMRQGTSVKDIAEGALIVVNS